MGRPSRLTPELQETIVSFIKTGVANIVAARAAGIEEATFYEWIARGEGRSERGDPDGRFAEFAEAVTRARAEREAYLAGLVVQAAPHDWKAAAWVLERTMPNRWGKSTRTELVGSGGGPVEVRAAPPLPLDEAIAREMQAKMDQLGGVALGPDRGDTDVLTIADDDVIDVEPHSPNGNGYHGNGDHP